MLDFFLDLPNFLVILLFVTLSYSAKLIPTWLAITLGVLSSSPFFINDFIFPASYMPDQFRYLNVVQHLRAFDLNHGEQTSVKWAGWMMTFLPLPLAETIKSLGFFNRFSLTILIIWLYAYKAVRGVPLMVMIFYPSLVLYSSLALRDILILICMVVTIVLYIERRIVFSLTFVSFLVFIKIQNFFLMIAFMIIYDMADKNTLINKSKFLIFIFFVIFLTLSGDVFIESLNYHRVAMHAEDGVGLDSIIQISGMNDLIFIGVPSAFYFLVKPLPWEAANFFQLIQSLENIVIVFFLAYLAAFFWKRNKILLLKWFLFFFISLFLYGLVVSNFGTSVRYKFTFVMVLIIGIYYDIDFSRRNFKSKGDVRNVVT